MLYTHILLNICVCLAAFGRELRLHAYLADDVALSQQLHPLGSANCGRILFLGLDEFCGGNICASILSHNVVGVPEVYDDSFIDVIDRQVELLGPLRIAAGCDVNSRLAFPAIAHEHAVEAFITAEILAI